MPAMRVRCYLAVVLAISAVTAHGIIAKENHRRTQANGIRPLPCQSRYTKEDGVCMFAWNCMTAKGTHLSPCFDGIFIGSCCKLVTHTPETNQQNEVLQPAVFKPIPETTKPSSFPFTSTSTPGLITWRPLEATTEQTHPTMVIELENSSPFSDVTTQNTHSVTTQMTLNTEESTENVSTSLENQVTTVYDSLLNLSPVTSTSIVISVPESTTSENDISETFTFKDETVPETEPTETIPTTTLLSINDSSYSAISNSTIHSTSIMTEANNINDSSTATTSDVDIEIITIDSVQNITSKPLTPPTTRRPISTTTTRPRPSVRPRPSTRRPTVRPRPTTRRPTTRRPIITSQRPRPTTRRPVVTSYRPRPTTRRPIITSQRPRPTTRRPIVTSHRPRPTTGRPITTTELNQPTTLEQTITPEIPTTPKTESNVETVSTFLQTTEIITRIPTSTDTYSTMASPTDHTTTSSSPITETTTAWPKTTTRRPPTTVPPVTMRPFSNAPISTTTISNEIGPLPIKNNTDSQDYKEVCGIPNPGPQARIVGGVNARYAEWPWMISLRQLKKNTFLHKCGAALLNEFWAITAAHCVESVSPGDLLLRLGEYDISNEKESEPYEERRVQIIASHPKFDPRTFEFDLALLRFYEPIRFRRNILPICVPEGQNQYVGKMATVTGWGRLYEDGPLPNVMQEVHVPVLTNRECESMYKKAGFAEDIPDIFICSGYSEGGRDSCEGDSGGPMVLKDGDRWILAGVISWGIGCALPNQPGVYSRITKFSDWITQIIAF